MIYDTLEQCELTQYLGDNRERFDLIVSADTLVYFGDLEPVVCRRGGRVAVRRAPGLHARACRPRRGSVGYRLEFHGRYTHSRAYVERMLAAAGLRSQIAEADLRMESGMPVAGLVIRAAKP